MYIGASEFQQAAHETKGSFIHRDGEVFYKIEHYQAMPAFFMSVVSSSDHWLFIFSNGALTAGRKNPDYALFPYYTDDKIRDAAEVTGSKTILRVRRLGKEHLWEPFSERYQGLYQIQRNLYKNALGNKVIFEEINEDLGLTFHYGWYTSDRYGLVRKAGLINNGTELVTVQLLDGIQNILPFGVGSTMQNRVSTLVDAYKKSELEKATGLGIYALSSIIVDRAEPSEALRCNTVWSAGLSSASRLLSSRQLSAFRAGGDVVEEVDIRAERGAHFLQAELALTPHEREEWYLVAEVNQGPAEVAALQQLLRDTDNLPERLKEDIQVGTDKLAALLGAADAVQLTADEAMCNRHLANVLFNVMRGGVFLDHYQVGRDDLIDFLHSRNRPVSEVQSFFLEGLPEQISYPDLLQKAGAGGDEELLRLCYEYLPLTFSRRHGDPSRPWNMFSIELKAPDGSPSLYYAGNWRDIFQNWEALAFAYPHFVEGMISKFVNASTADGYNPYRITRDGIDWETIEPDDPWSYIGYWGDHQIIYLQKLLEVSRMHHPGELERLLTQPLFSYANVPYRIKAYEDLLRDPFDTVTFDDELEAAIEEQVRRIGSDGKLLLDDKGRVYQVNLTEKLLVSVLAKFSNFIPEGGIWLNTQRPEWNDANNALVGNGVSMVTLYYLRRFQSFCRDLFTEAGEQQYQLSEEVAVLFRAITGVLDKYHSLLQGPISKRDRRSILDGLGQAGSQYRTRIYEQSFSGASSSITSTELLHFIDLSLAYIDHSIRANQRTDTLYHAYNLMTVEKDGGIAIDYLYEMLEGQVAVLSSGLLSGSESLKVLQALRKSALYREDQHSYLLYPDRELSRFTEKNNIPASAVDRSPLLQQLISDGNQELVVKDAAGGFHFNGSIRNAGDVAEILERLGQGGYSQLVKEGTAGVLALFEELFDHKSFTGRSGTFFAYEGLGSIYWHMVSKLLLAAQEVAITAIASGEGKEVTGALIDAFYDVRAGIGFNKTPEEYGAFPSDPYSHTPAHAGARQPGMTGQVKEDILVRFGELGVVVEGGKISFQPSLLRREEFLSQAADFQYYQLDGQPETMAIPAGCLAFTYCQVPILYHQSKEGRMVVHFEDGRQLNQEGLEVDTATSAAVFGRSGEVRLIEVWLDPSI